MRLQLAESLTDKATATPAHKLEVHFPEVASWFVVLTFITYARVRARPAFPHPRNILTT